MKKLLLVSGLIFILLFLAFIIISGLKKPSAIPAPVENAGTPGPVNQGGNKRIKISGVETNNFLTNPIRSSVDGAVLFLKTESLEALYYKKYDQFNLIISSSSAQVRNRAEQEFLQKLGVSKQDACRLDVVVNSPYVPNPNLLMPKRTLSFCPSKKQEY